VSEKRQRTQLVTIRMTPDEKRRVTEAAMVAGVSVSEFIRDAAMAVAVDGPTRKTPGARHEAQDRGGWVTCKCGFNPPAENPRDAEIAVFIHIAKQQAPKPEPTGLVVAACARGCGRPVIARGEYCGEPECGPAPTLQNILKGRR
jgi:hypothetical protein